MNELKPAAIAALAVLAATLLTACGGSAGSSTRAGAARALLRGQTITLYSGQHEQTTALLVSAFERRTGVKVQVRSGDEAELADQILQEGSSSPADVFYAENTPPLERLREQSLLSGVAPATLAQIPARYSSAQGDWVGITGRISVLVYNTALLAPSALPTSILALAQPGWKGKLAIAPSETDFQPLIASIVKLHGAAAAERWLQAIKQNSKIYPNDETVVTQVNNGESAVGLINHYYWFRLRAEVGAASMHSALAYYAPRDAGDLLDISGAAVLKSSSHQAAAQAFLAFLVSAEGQRVLARSHSYEYPLHPGVAPAKGLRPFAQLQPAPISPAELGDGAAPLELEQKLGLL